MNSEEPVALSGESTACLPGGQPRVRTARGADRAFPSPTPEMVKEARLAAGLTQVQAARLVRATVRTWQGWEAPAWQVESSPMHPGLWELFELKTGRF